MQNIEKRRIKRSRNRREDSEGKILVPQVMAHFPSSQHMIYYRNASKQSIILLIAYISVSGQTEKQPTMRIVFKSQLPLCSRQEGKLSGLSLIFTHWFVGVEFGELKYVLVAWKVKIRTSFLTEIYSHSRGISIILYTIYIVLLSSL